MKLVKSFARIHKANLINYGIIPLELADPANYAALAQGDTIRFPGIRAAIIAGRTEIPFEVGGQRYAARLAASERDRKILAAGGLLNLAKKG